jgi:hypothetical protein
MDAYHGENPFISCSCYSAYELKNDAKAAAVGLYSCLYGIVFSFF